MSDRIVRVALAGNPNVGKTSLFNVLTGSRHQVGNYAGVTVERREGWVSTALAGARQIRLLDLPGTYSLSAISEDEAVAFRVITGEGEPPPSVVLLVVDATNLARNLYLALQLREIGVPLVIALNMMDVARAHGLPVDAERLQKLLGVPVVPTVARTAVGAKELVRALVDVEPDSALCLGPGGDQRELADVLRKLGSVASPARARWLVTSGAAATAATYGASDDEISALARISSSDLARAAEQLVALRYREVDRMLLELDPTADMRAEARPLALSERIDRVLTHRVWGIGVFAGVMATVFVSIFTWATPLMDLIEAFVSAIANGVELSVGPGLLGDLLANGVIAGAGNVLVFVPQIALLFLFIGLLEDSGYLARAAFLMDRIMARLGLHGRAFIPLLSGYACAIPAILGTRTISSVKDRMVTILMIPFMSCSARLPIYSLVIGALFVTAGDDWRERRRISLTFTRYPRLPRGAKTHALDRPPSKKEKP